MADRDYVLGTEDEEVERLGLQHRVWRPRMLDGFARAGIGRGMTVIDVGCGPGYASLDLAEIVGPDGRVLALERSARFLDVLVSRAARLGLANNGPRPATCRRRISERASPTPPGAAGCSASWPIRRAPSPMSLGR